MNFATEDSATTNRRSSRLRFIAIGLLAVGLILLILFLVLRLDNEPTSEEVVVAFEEQGLETGDTSEIPTEDYGPVPSTYEEGTRFEIPSLGADSGGRVFTGSQNEVREVAEYYRAFGSPQSILGSS